MDIRSIEEDVTGQDSVLNSPLLMYPCIALLFVISLANYHLIAVSYTDPVVAAKWLTTYTVPVLSIVLLATFVLLVHLTKHRLAGKKLRLVFYVSSVVLAASATGNHVQVLREGGLDVQLKLADGVLTWGGVVPQRLPDIDRLLARAGGQIQSVVVSNLTGVEYINAENMAIYLASNVPGGVNVTGSCANACALFWLMNEGRSLSEGAKIGLPGDSGSFSAPHEIFVAVLTSALHNAGTEVGLAESTVRGIPKGTVKWMSRNDVEALNIALVN